MGQLQSFQGLDFFYIKLSVLTEAATTLWNQNAFKESHQGCRQNLQTIFIFYYSLLCTVLWTSSVLHMLRYRTKLKVTFPP